MRPKVRKHCPIGLPSLADVSSVSIHILVNVHMPVSNVVTHWS